MIDTDPILRLAQQLADEITKQTEEAEADTAFVRQVMVVVELDLGSSTTMFTSSADDRPWVQIAFLERAADHLAARPVEVSLDDD